MSKRIFLLPILVAFPFEYPIFLLQSIGFLLLIVGLIAYFLVTQSVVLWLREEVAILLMILGALLILLGIVLGYIKKRHVKKYVWNLSQILMLSVVFKRTCMHAVRCGGGWWV